MKDGFIKCAAGTVDVRVADVDYNKQQILLRVKEAADAGVHLLILPELCLSGYTCGDLFFTDTLLEACRDALSVIATETNSLPVVFALGCPLRFQGKLYNCAVVFHRGKILGAVPKTALPNYREFYELRQFSSGKDLEKGIYTMTSGKQSFPFGRELLFQNECMPEFTFGLELCEDLWIPEPPSGTLCAMGATIIGNLSASDEIIGKEEYRRLLVSSVSARMLCGYIYANASPSESTQDMVFSKHHILAENGSILKENRPFEKATLTVSEVDVKRLCHERHCCTTFTTLPAKTLVVFEEEPEETLLTRRFSPTPFVPSAEAEIRERAETILNIQSYGLKKRLEHTRAQTAVLGISGGLDSTLALLVTVRAFDLLCKSRKEILCVTMPCFGTTHRTKNNAILLCKALGVTLKEIDITASVRRHFADIGQREEDQDVTFENGQARERTQILMDLANKTGGLVVGTGDLSELALGWATYNGDHMSMYAVNASVPKTLVRYIIRYEASLSDQALSAVLDDILDTPVSPELLPATENGEIAQKTEDLVGPYELHDFFLYHFLRYGASVKKIFRLALLSFDGVYTRDTILKWLKVFFRRFFISQFKRSCLPDGPKVGSLTLSPRSDFRMPSDASFALWVDEAESL